MTTFADIKKVTNFVSTFVDDQTPVGHFGVTTNVAGCTTTYLMEGEKDAADAVVKGRVLIKVIEGRARAIGYSKGGLDGGILMGSVENYAEAFAKMV